MVNVDPDWWKTLFDETYLITDARSVCDEDVTCREVDYLVQALKLEKSWPILDLCGGQGRHSLEFSRRGFQDVTVVDYSRVLIELGRKRAREEGLNTRFVCQDARRTSLPGQSFKVVIIMASSLGYFADQSQDLKILREAFRLLMPRGLLFLDLPDRDHIVSHFTDQSWHEADADIVVCRHRRMDDDVINSREVVISKTKGLIRDATYCTRLYEPQNIRRMLRAVGFEPVTVQKGNASRENGVDYGLMTHRMTVIGTKG